MRAWILRQWHYFVPEEVVRTFSFHTLCRFEPCVEVTIFLLTRDDLRYKMPLASKHCSRRLSTAEPILTELHSQHSHCQHTWAISSTSGTRLVMVSFTCM